MNYDDFWAKVRETGWNPTAAEMRAMLNERNDYLMVRDAYDRALEKLVMARTFMTLEAQQAFDEEWSRHMHKNYDLKGAAESIKELIDSQSDLPADAKAVLYGNLDRLYLR